MRVSPEAQTLSEVSADDFLFDTARGLWYTGITFRETRNDAIGDPLEEVVATWNIVNEVTLGASFSL